MLFNNIYLVFNSNIIIIEPIQLVAMSILSPKHNPQAVTDNGFVIRL